MREEVGGGRGGRACVNGDSNAVSQGTFSDVMASGGARFPGTDAIAGRPSDSRIAAAASASIDSLGGGSDFSSENCAESLLLDWSCCCPICAVETLSVTEVFGKDTGAASFCATAFFTPLETSTCNPNIETKVMPRSMNDFRSSGRVFFEDSSGTVS
jgi:hypothetical protein